MQSVLVTMRNPLPWPKSRYVCSKDVDVSVQRYKVMKKEEDDDGQVDSRRGACQDVACCQKILN